MRRFTWLVFLAMAFLTVHASPTYAVRQVVTVNPFGFLFGIVNAAYEWPADRERSYAVEGGFLLWRSRDVSFTGLQAGAGLRFYPQRQSPPFDTDGQVLRGFYYGPRAGVALFTARDEGTGASATSTVISVGGLAGYQWISEGGFVVNGNVGLHLAFGTVSAFGVTTPVSTGLGTSLGLAVGYAW